MDSYNKLQNLKQIKFYIIVIFIIISFLIFVVVANFIKIPTKVIIPGYYYNNLLNVKINTTLSDTFYNAKYIIFNNKKTKFEIINLNEPEINENAIYQNINLNVDKKFMENEVGMVEIYTYQILIKYVFELFK